ncbi:hypothetical protein ACFWNL_18325 [Kitasatospora sp. NPDC058397]|uniref:hypothetical protein n=1 Tax=unclassified Kitasatospora TaxID=2633591 RepID=UPI0036531431
MTSPPDPRSQQNKADFWNDRQDKVETWKRSAEVQWDLVRSVANKRGKRGDDSVWEELSKLLNTFYVNHSE